MEHNATIINIAPALGATNQTDSTEAPAESVPFEVECYRKYIRLGITERDAKAERAKYKAEIEGLMADGVQVGENGRALRHSYETRAEFDWKRAVADGKIRLEDLRDYCEVSVVRVLRDTNMTEDDGSRESRLNVIRHHAPTIFVAVANILQAEPDTLPEAIECARAVYEKSGDWDAVDACMESVRKAAKKGGKR